MEAEVIVLRAVRPVGGWAQAGDLAIGDSVVGCRPATIRGMRQATRHAWTPVAITQSGGVG